MGSFTTTAKSRIPPSEQRWSGGGMSAEPSHDGQDITLHFSLWCKGKRRDFHVEVDARHFSCVGSRAIRKAVKVQRQTAANVESWLVKEVAGE